MSSWGDHLLWRVCSIEELKEGGPFTPGDHLLKGQVYFMIEHPLWSELHVLLMSVLVEFEKHSHKHYAYLRQETSCCTSLEVTARQLCVGRDS